MIGGYGSSCRPAFMALDVSEKYGPAMILGEIFMRHFFTVFSRGDGDDANAKIGIAPAKIGAQPKVRIPKTLSFPSDATSSVMDESDSELETNSKDGSTFISVNAKAM